MQPLRRYSVLDTRSESAARADRALFRRTDRFVAFGPSDAFRLTINSTLLDDIRLSAVATTGHGVRPIDEENAALLLPLRGLLRTDDGRGEVAVREGAMALPRPGLRSTVLPAPYLGLVVQVPLARLARRAALNPADGWAPDRHWPARPGTAAGPGALLHRQVRHLVADLDAEETLLAYPRAAASAADLLTDLLLECFRAEAAEAATREAPASLRQVQQAEAAIRARAQDAVSLPGLAAELGIGTRALQLAFRRHRGTTPSAFLAACRLDLIRRRLAAAPPETTVTAIALDCGVAHLGRFAAQYRARFGESPSATLARAQRRG